MCRRFCLTSTPDIVQAAMGYHQAETFPPRAEIAPGEPVAILRVDHRRRRELALVRWGFVPAWARDPTQRSMTVARAETAAEKPAFRAAMRHRRCLVPADGFIDFVGGPDDRGRVLIRCVGGGLLAFAALWEHWLGADGSEFETMAILTVPADGVAARFNPRMPAILPPARFADWLDVSSGRSGEATEMLRTAPRNQLEAIELGTGRTTPPA